MDALSTAHAATDKALDAMEKHVRSIYLRSVREIYKSWQKFFEKESKKIEKLQEDYEKAKKSGDKKLIKETGIALEREKKKETVQNKRFHDAVKQTAENLLHVNEKAVEYLNGRLPETYVTNFNAVGELCEGAVTGYSYHIVDENTVRELAMSDTSLLPYKEIDPAKDIAWNVRQMKSEVLQGILQGENMQTIAKRLSNVIGMNENSAVRNARTMVTAAENKGRQDGFYQAEEDGIILEKYWLCVHGERTREAHAAAGNDYAKAKSIPQSQPFIVGGEELMFPGDNSMGASGWNLYNCRCSVAAVVKGFKKAQAQKDMAEKQEEFAPAKTKKEAEQYAKRFADEVSYSGISVENCNEINKTLDELQRKYPSKKYSKIVGKKQKATASANYETLTINGSKIGSKEGAETFETMRKWDKYTLEALRAKYPGKMPPDVAKKVEKLEQNLRFDRWSISNTYGARATITHEYAHTLSDQYFGMINDTIANPNARSEECLAIKRKIDETRKKAWETGDIFSVSKYATTDDDEFFAEVFAMREMGEKIPDYFDEMLEEALKNGIM